MTCADAPEQGRIASRALFGTKHTGLKAEADNLGERLRPLFTDDVEDAREGGPAGGARAHGVAELAAATLR